MAIIKMKRFHMIAMKEEQKKLIELLQKLGCLEISDANMEFEQKPSESKVPSQDIDKLKWTIEYLGKYCAEKKPLFATDRFVPRHETIEILNKKEEIFNLVFKAEECEKKSGSIISDTIKLNAQRADFIPWEDLSIKLSEVHNSHSTVQMLGYIPNVSLLKLEENTDFSKKLVHLETINTLSGNSYIYIIAYSQDANEAIKILKDNGFNQVQFNQVDATAKQKLNDINEQIKNLGLQEQNNRDKLISLSNNLPDIQLLYDVLRLEYQREKQDANFVKTNSSIYLKGWVPQLKADQLVKNIKELSKNVEIEILDPEEGEEPPVVIENNNIVKPFESVVLQFSYPAANGLDPTPLMMPFFANFFGMMLSDAGYGILMLMFIPIIIWKFKPKMGTKNMLKLLLWGAGATVVWGILFNTWFGFAPLPTVFDPINNPMPTMMVCLVLGLIHMLFGLGAAAYINIQHGDYWAVLFDQVSWAFLLLGLGMLIIPSIATVGKVLAILGAIIIIIMAGREKKNIFGRIMGGFGALYGVVGWISDILSYMRLFGMGLATGVIGMVINKLVGMVFNSGIIGMILGSVLFVGAHLFNMGINALGAYVHSCRLQYIEFFSKFFMDGGKPFKPLSEDTKYVSIIDEKNKNDVQTAQI